MGRTTKGARQPETILAVGRVVRPHGVRGGLIVDAYSEAIEALRPGGQVLLGEQKQPGRLQSCKRHADRYLVFLEGVEDREQAEELRGAEIAIPFDDAGPLPEGAYYHWQVLGLRVEEDGGQELGHISEILETGANDVYVVKRADGGEVLLPAISSVIREVDLEHGIMRVHLIPGLLPSEDSSH
jgi:16S rRNA processing protein RimM